MTAESGQASVEAVAGIAALMLAAALCFQLLATGYSSTLADGAAEAGAVALVQGKPVDVAVRKALPGWARSRYSVTHLGDRVEVRLQPPALIASLGDRLELTSSATAESP
ncbi:MAG: hypothetical protein JJE13_11705 [Thermoleophilia bacterium]|nr:hypothetical protein [Thermoleophilia bacterium]